MEGKFFEDFNEGDKHTSAWRAVSESHFRRFVDLTGLQEPLFESRQYLDSMTDHDAWMVPGILTLSMSVGLFTRSGWIEGTAVAMLGIEDLSWKSPVFVDDEIRITVEVTETTPTSADLAGVVILDWTTENQDGEVVIEMTSSHYMKKRVD